MPENNESNDKKCRIDFTLRIDADGITFETGKGHTGSKLDLEGIIPAVVTPMDDVAEVDEKQLSGYIDWLRGFHGLKGLAVNMDTGEGPQLTDEEKSRIIGIYSRY